MSNYMRALRRHAENHLPKQTAALSAAVRRVTREAGEIAALRLAPVPAASERAVGATAELLDRLRAPAAQGGPARVLVFVPVQTAGAARAVVDGLAARGRDLGLSLAVAELIRHGGAAMLTARRPGIDVPARAVELDGPGLGRGLADWLGGCAAAPLVLIEGPAALAAVDGLLLGAACDGVVLVAETGRTERAALRTAADRARAAGCRVLGVVLTAAAR
ncbi:MAG: hypothetical protein AB7V27_07230 [Candidatus Binatia bacterium]